MSLEIIDLELSQNLKELGIVQDFFFEAGTTQNFILELNTIYKDVHIIFHYYKDWNRTKRKAKEAIIEKGIQKLHIKAILDTLDTNYHNVTTTQENYNQDTTADDDQEHGQKESTRKGNKEEKDDEDDGKTTYTINKYSQGIPLAESILINNIPYFIQIINNNKPLLSSKIELSDIGIAPPERIEYLSKEYNFASVEEIEYFINLAKTETLDSIFQLVKSFWIKYIDVNEDFINVCAADTIFSYFQDKLGMCHYLLIVGDNNSGKSNILLLFSLVGYRPLYDTAITPANIYNFCGQLEEGQGIIIEDEIDDIDFQDEKKKLYKVSYRSGTKITRMYDNINSSGANKKSSRQQAFLLYCFKIFASERIPNKIKSKGFLERIIPLKSISGDPQYDISEVVNDAGDEQFKKLYEELMNTRKLLLMYRLLHHNDPIPDVKLNIKNRYKQLTKPLIRLFQNSESLDGIIKSLSKYLIEKNEEKINSLDSGLLFLIIDLVAKHSTILYNDQIWEEIKKRFRGTEIADKPYSYYCQEYGTISKSKIRSICESKFDAKEHKDEKRGRGLIFNQGTLNKLTANYSIIEGIKIIKEDPTKRKHDTPDTPDTYTKDIEPNSENNSPEDSSKIQEPTSNDEGKTLENDNLGLKTGTYSDKKCDRSSPEVSGVSGVSGMHFNTYDRRGETTEESKSISLRKKIDVGLFTNSLISESDLLTGNYNPEIINNIDRVHPNSDRWFCNHCTMRGDKWFMMKHPCKNNINNKGGSKLI
jgi:hypothetical protein